MPLNFSISFAEQVAIFLTEVAELTSVGPALRGIVSQRAFFSLQELSKWRKQLLFFPPRKLHLILKSKDVWSLVNHGIFKLCHLTILQKNCREESTLRYEENFIVIIGVEKRKSNSIFNFKFWISLSLPLFMDQLRLPTSSLFYAAVNRPRFISL